MPGRYSTDEPCPRGHLAERYVSSKGCVECARASTKKANERKSAERKSNPAKYKEIDRGHHLSRYGITAAEYDSMFAAQNGVCAVCSSPPGTLLGRRLAVDHCHSSGKVRGLLCHSCNSGVGRFKDSVELLNAAAKYIGGAECRP